MRVYGAEPEHGYPVVAVVPAFLHDGYAPANGLADAQFDAVCVPRKALRPYSCREPIQKDGLRCVRGRGKPAEGEALACMKDRSAHAEMIDRHEDSIPRCMPRRLGNAARAREVMRVIEANSREFFSKDPF